MVVAVIMIPATRVLLFVAHVRLGHVAIVVVVMALLATFVRSMRVLHFVAIRRMRVLLVIALMVRGIGIVVVGVGISLHDGILTGLGAVRLSKCGDILSAFGDGALDGIESSSPSSAKRTKLGGRHAGDLSEVR